MLTRGHAPLSNIPLTLDELKAEKRRLQQNLSKWRLKEKPDLAKIKEAEEELSLIIDQLSLIIK